MPVQHPVRIVTGRSSVLYEPPGHALHHPGVRREVKGAQPLDELNHLLLSSQRILTFSAGLDGGFARFLESLGNRWVGQLHAGLLKHLLGDLPMTWSAFAEVAGHLVSF